MKAMDLRFIDIDGPGYGDYDSTLFGNRFVLLISSYKIKKFTTLTESNKIIVYVHQNLL